MTVNMQPVWGPQLGSILLIILMYVRNIFNAVDLMEYLYMAVFLQPDALLAYYSFDTLTLTLVLSSSLHPVHSFPSFLLDNHLILCTSTSPLSLFSFRPLYFIPSSFHLAFFTSPHLFPSFTSLSTSPLHPPPLSGEKCRSFIDLAPASERGE